MLATLEWHNGLLSQHLDSKVHKKALWLDYYNVYKVSCTTKHNDFCPNAAFFDEIKQEQCIQKWGGRSKHMSQERIWQQSLHFCQLYHAMKTVQDAESTRIGCCNSCLRSNAMPEVDVSLAVTMNEVLMGCMNSLLIWIPLTLVPWHYLEWQKATRKEPVLQKILQTKWNLRINLQKLVSSWHTIPNDYMDLEYWETESSPAWLERILTSYDDNLSLLVTANSCCAIIQTKSW